MKAIELADAEVLKPKDKAPRVVKGYLIREKAPVLFGKSDEYCPCPVTLHALLPPLLMNIEQIKDIFLGTYPTTCKVATIDHLDSHGLWIV